MSWLITAERNVLRFLAYRYHTSGRHPTTAKLDDLRRIIARAQETTASSVSLDDIATLSATLLLTGETTPYVDQANGPPAGWQPDPLDFTTRPLREDLWVRIPPEGPGRRVWSFVNELKMADLAEKVKKAQVEMHVTLREDETICRVGSFLVTAVQGR